MLRLHTFGGLWVEGPDGPPSGAAAQPKALALLSLLAPAGRRGVGRDRLASYLWPEGENAKVTHRITQLLYALRRDLAEDVFAGTGSIRLNVDVMSTDVDDFSRALEGGDFATAARVYQGPFLEGFVLREAPEFERWAESERGRLAERYRAVLESLAQDAEGRADLPAAAGWWKQLSEEDPLDPRGVIRYLDTLDRLGDRIGALRFAQAHAALLRAEFDLEPDPQVRATVERLQQPAAARSASLPPAPAIAVLPFTNLTPDHENQYFSEGMTEELTNALGRVPGLRVASRLAAQRFSGRAQDPRDTAAQLGVSALVCGSVRKVGTRIRVVAELVHGADGCQLWSETYERTLEDVFALQEAISWAIVGALPLTASGGALPLVRAPTPAIDAYTLYLRGRYSALKRTPAGLALGAEYFEQAVERDPHYALAHAGYAETQVLLGFPEFGPLPALEAMPRAKAAALEALRLDPRLPEAHCWLAVIHFLFDWDWPAAEERFRRVLQLRRDHPYAHAWFGLFLSAMGRHEESLNHVFYGETLEPAAPQIRLCVPRSYYFAGRFDEALESAEELWRAEPGAPVTALWLGRILCAMGRFEEAYTRLREIPDDRRTPYFTSGIAVALAGMQRRAEAQGLCQQLQGLLARGEGPAPSGLAQAYCLLTDPPAAQAAIALSERHRNGHLAWLAVDPMYGCLRGLPEFDALLRRMGLSAVAGRRDTRGQTSGVSRTLVADP